MSRDPVAGLRATIDLDLSALSGANIGLVDALARLALEARRHGVFIRIVGGPSELIELIDLTGLAAVFGLEPPSGRQPRRQPEQREQARGVEEEGHGGDPVA